MLIQSSGSENLPLPNNSDQHTGDLTFYNPGLGACGETSTDNDDIVSLSWKIWNEVQTGSDPNQVVLCGKKIRARRFNEDVSAERSVDLTVVDRCKWSIRQSCGIGEILIFDLQALVANLLTSTSALALLRNWRPLLAVE